VKNETACDQIFMQVLGPSWLTFILIMVNGLFVVHIFC